jgi:hypothetical protein
MKNGRCRMHGGPSRGAKTAEGKERFRRAVTVHGLASGPGNPLNQELYGTDAPGPRWRGHASTRGLARRIEKVIGALDELEKLEK